MAAFSDQSYSMKPIGGLPPCRSMNAFTPGAA